ncbi:MAG: hypothetical protein N2443_07355 [Blastocatellia bacterium]|nr:hypothetical protein [Blastocatellia bacterium]MCX7752673.1 hypothetical protein [Blastocatellia bacterium]MDW8255600.1 hypothetical protein [Acidobacteriota bacterium]
MLTLRMSEERRGLIHTARVSWWMPAALDFSPRPLSFSTPFYFRPPRADERD